MFLNSKEKHMCELPEVWLKDDFVKFHKVNKGENHEEKDRMSEESVMEKEMESAGCLFKIL